MTCHFFPWVSWRYFSIIAWHWISFEKSFPTTWLYFTYKRLHIFICLLKTYLTLKLENMFVFTTWGQFSLTYSVSFQYVDLIFHYFRSFFFFFELHFKYLLYSIFGGYRIYSLLWVLVIDSHFLESLFFIMFPFFPFSLQKYMMSVLPCIPSYVVFIYELFVF